MAQIPDIESLDDKRQHALNALLECPTVSAASKRANIPRRTMYRYLQEPEFSAVYKTAQKQALEHATGKLRASASQAVQTLIEIALNPDPPASAKTRVAAAKAALQYAYVAHDQDEIQEKIAELERLLNE